MADSLKHVIGGQVRTARATKKWTQSELASRIDRSVEAISNIERGMSLPTIDTLERIARVTQIEIVRFFMPSELSASSHSRVRTAKMRRLKEACDKLNDRDLAIAVEQVEALARRVK